MISSSYLYLLIVSLLNSSVISKEFLGCSVPKSFQIETEDNNKIFINDADVEVKYYENDLAICKIPELDVVSIFIPNMTITFSGYVEVGNEELPDAIVKTFKDFNFELTGTSPLTKNTSNDTMFADCNVVLLGENSEDDSIVMNNIENDLIKRMSTCIKTTICDELDSGLSNNTERGRNQSKNGDGDNKSLKLIEHSSNTFSNFDTDNVSCLIRDYETNVAHLNAYDVHSFMDIIIDETINAITTKFREESNGTINVPDIQQRFSTGASIFKVSGEFNAFNGIFQDLTTLSREGYVVVKNNGLKRLASCGFGISVAYLRYNNYELKYGRIKVKGNISANINGIVVFISLLADFDQKPCRLSVDTLQITKFGSIKIKITGGGELNTLLSKLASLISNKWHNDIVKKIEQKIKSLALQKMSSIDCEKYRKYITKQ